jgi:hypothetical protein
MEIIVNINTRTGETSVEGVGYDGIKCVEDIDKLMALLGMETYSEVAKPEYVSVTNSMQVRR